MVATPHLTRFASRGLTLLGDTRRPGGVTLAFAERTGGCSAAPYASLNLGERCGDDPQAVAENRRRLLAALGCEHLAARLVNPVQVHGAQVVVLTDGSDAGVRAAQAAAREGADAVVCTVCDVPVLLCFADCVPVVLVAPGAFAVVHSGRAGCELEICAAALKALCAAAGCTSAQVSAYVGPHIAGEDYEVSPEMAARFAQLFGAQAVLGERNVDLGYAVRQTLERSGVAPQAILDECPSTAATTERFFSYRAEGGVCGRHGACAVMLSEAREEGSAHE